MTCFLPGPALLPKRLLSSQSVGIPTVKPAVLTLVEWLHRNQQGSSNFLETRDKETFWLWQIQNKRCVYLLWKLSILLQVISRKHLCQFTMTVYLMESCLWKHGCWSQHNHSDCGKWADLQQSVMNTCIWTSSSNKFCSLFYDWTEHGDCYYIAVKAVVEQQSWAVAVRLILVNAMILLWILNSYMKKRVGVGGTSRGTIC